MKKKFAPYCHSVKNLSKQLACFLFFGTITSSRIIFHVAGPQNTYKWLNIFQFLNYYYFSQ